MKLSLVLCKSPLCLALVVAAALLPNAVGDTLKLKDGTVLEGKATQMPPDSVKFNWRPKPSIQEEKIFKKTEIAELIVQSPDEEAVIPLRKLLPTNDNLSAAEYTKVIEGQIKPYLAKFPSSKFAKEVQTMLDTYTSELNKVNLGGIKLEGKWIAPEDFKTKDYLYKALMLRKEMQAELKQNHLKEALEKVIRLKTEYVGSPAFAASIDDYDKMLNDHHSALIAMQQEQPGLMAEQDARKKTLNKAELDEMDLALKKNTEELKVKVSIETQSKTPILSFDKMNLPSLKAAQSAIQKEMAAVAKIKDAKPRYLEASQLVEKALNESAQGNPVVASTQYELAKKALPVPPDVKLAALMAAAKAASDEMNKTVPKPAPSTGAAPAKGDPSRPAKSGDKAPAKASGTSKGEGDEPSKPPVAALPEDEDNTMMYLLGGAGALVVAGLGWAMMSKRKKKDEG